MYNFCEEDITYFVAFLLPPLSMKAFFEGSTKAYHNFFLSSFRVISMLNLMPQINLRFLQKLREYLPLFKHKHNSIFNKKT